MTTKTKKPLVVKVELHELVRDEWDDVMRVPETTLLWFARFYQSWTSIAPLVRSGAGMQLLLVARRFAVSNEFDEAASAHGLTRRVAVHGAFKEAHIQLARHIATLIRDADEEAKRRGIDGDLSGP